MKLSSNKNSSSLLLILLVAALLFAVFYYIVLPKKEEVESLENSVGSLQTEIKTIRTNITALEAENSKENTDVFEIRQKLPQSREIDQLLLNLEEIEFVSKTRITSIGFNSYDALVSESAIAPSPEEEAEITEETEAAENVEGEETGETGETPVSEIAAQTLPPELKLITFNIEIESPASQNIQLFIEEIENLKRIMHIDSISYSLPGEEGEFTDEEETLHASIQVTTFYYEGEK